MRAAEIHQLYDYNAWATERVLGATAQLSPEQFVAPAPVSFGSLRATLVHLLSAEWMWRMRVVAGISPERMLDETTFPNVAALGARFTLEGEQMRQFVAGLDDAALERVVHYTTTKGQPFATPLWQVLLHVVNHGTQFRSEAAVVLTTLQASPGDLDLIAFFRARSS